MHILALPISHTGELKRSAGPKYFCWAQEGTYTVLKYFSSQLAYNVCEILKQEIESKSASNPSTYSTKVIFFARVQLSTGIFYLYIFVQMCRY
jgi:hypothetical protein